MARRARPRLVPLGTAGAARVISSGATPATGTISPPAARPWSSTASLQVEQYQRPQRHSGRRHNVQQHGRRASRSRATPSNWSGDLVNNKRAATPDRQPRIGVERPAIETSTSAAGNVVVNGSISDDGGSRGLIKSGPAALVLNAANTYGGATTITAGTLHALDAGGSILQSPNISISAGGVFDVTAQGSGFHLVSRARLCKAAARWPTPVTADSGSTLIPGGSNVGTLTLDALTVSSGATINYQFNGSSNSQIIVNTSGGLTINGGAACTSTRRARPLPTPPSAPIPCFNTTGIALGGSDRQHFGSRCQ